MSTAQSPFPRHEDVVVSFPDGTTGAFRVIELCPFDFTRCAEPFGRMISRLHRGQTLGSLSITTFADALECLDAVADPLDKESRKHGVRGVKDYASARRLVESFVRLNLLSEEAQQRVGKIMASVTEMILESNREKPSSRPTRSGTPSTSSSASATPSPTPDESPSALSPA